ncbi:hypothetical protein TPA0910_30160 [Streptomyces hygroscopicus subsp. sporocinereus]|uniref:Uncharacterized protein n=1 Tax=Streptomyces hygroscopicus TaxID=1912 RepID=A0ABQ3U047_STRHY|nr:hypothetical protein [Streptomyces hygroscopicus]GHJ28583.1 hypothetical protein TPA0910_30160 [Streptomyces hygroscopicus]
MTLQPPMMVRGADHSARAMRLMIRDLARGRQGVAGGEDLKVRPLETPGPGVRVGDGSALIHGARPWQGAYTQSNIGDTVVDVPPTGPVARTDLLVLRIEDPEFEGDRDPRRQEIGYFHLLQNIGKQDTTALRDMTAIPLARLTIPRNTATITAEMITDLRRLANPRTERTLRTVHPETTEKAPDKHRHWAAWPKDAAWDLDVPAWATEAAIVVTLSGLRAEAGPVYAELRTRLGERAAKPTVVDDDGTTTRRASVTLADTLAVPPAYRGTRQRLAIEINQNDKYGDGDLTVAKGTTVTLDVAFTEGPV